MTKPLALQRAEIIEAMCRRYPAYTPDTAAAAPMWVLEHMQIIGMAEGE